MKHLVTLAFFCLSLTVSAFASDGKNLDEVRLCTSTSPCINFSVVGLPESGTPLLHKYYLSVSNVTYSFKVKALQMVSRYFIDDLEDVLNERLDQKMKLGNPDDLADLKPILNRYFSKRVGFKVDGNDAIPKVIGAEYDVDQIVIYLEIPAAQSPTTVEVSNKSLMEIFPEQKNLTHFKINNERKSILNSAETPTDRVKF